MPLHSVNLLDHKQQQQQQGGKDGKAPFTASAEELHTIEEKMKDPKFRELLTEYMESLADPATRAEEEAYLEQAEREAREGGDYSFDFIFPRPSFTVELCNPTTRNAAKEELVKVAGAQRAAELLAAAESGSGKGRSVDMKMRSYLNFCVSDKVDVFTEETTGDAQGSRWHVPVSVCGKRLEYYYENRTKPSSSKGKMEGDAYRDVQAAAAKASAAPLASAPLCYVYDATFHPQTLALADRSNRFMCFLVEIAVEHINAGYKEANGFEFTRLPSAVTCVGYPKNQTIRKTGGQSPFAVDREAPVLTKPTKHIDEDPPPQKPVAKGKHPTATPKAAPAPAPAECLPPITITHRKQLDFSDAWSDPRLRDPSACEVPVALVVGFDFSRLSCGPIRASDVDVCVEEEGTVLRLRKTEKQTVMHGSVSLPYAVEDTPASATFDRKKQLLSLTLRTQSRYFEAPAHAAAAEQQKPAPAAAEQQKPAPAAAAEQQKPAPAAAQQKPAPAAAEQQKPAPAAAEQQKPAPAAAAEQQKPVPAAAEQQKPVPAVSQNEDRVKEMMRKVQEARQEREAAMALMEKAAAAAKTEVAAAAPPAAEVEGKGAEDITSIHKRPATGATADLTSGIGRSQQTAAMEALQHRQSAWAEAVAAAAEEQSESEAAAARVEARRARRDAEMAKVRYEAALHQEKVEAMARERRKEVPLNSQHIFQID